MPQTRRFCHDNHMTIAPGFLPLLLEALEPRRNNSTLHAGVVLGLMDCALEMSDDQGLPPQRLTVADLGNRMMALYWRQVKPHVKVPDSLLRQSDARITRVTSIIQDARRISGAQSHDVAAFQYPEVWYRTVRALSAHLVSEPLVSLQLMGLPRGTHVPFLFDDSVFPGSPETPEQAATMPIQLMPGVGEALITLAPALRPAVMDAWRNVVARLNTSAADAQLETFLFGSEQVGNARLIAPLTKAQRDRCPHCGERLIAEGAVDHAVPWSWTGNDGLANILIVHAGCMTDRGAAMLGPTPLRGWLFRDQDALAVTSDAMLIPIRSHRTAATARAIYAHLPDGYPLWEGRGKVIAMTSGIRDRIITALLDFEVLNQHV